MNLYKCDNGEESVHVPANTRDQALILAARLMPCATDISVVCIEGNEEAPLILAAQIEHGLFQHFVCNRVEDLPANIDFIELDFDTHESRCIEYPEKNDLIQISMPNGENKPAFVASHLCDPSGYDLKEILVVHDDEIAA